MMRRTALGLLAGGTLAARHLVSGQLPSGRHPAAAGPAGAAGGIVVIPPSAGDSSGAIQQALNSGAAVQLEPGDYHISTGLTMGVFATGGVPAMLAGCGPATRLIFLPVKGAFTGTAMLTLGNLSMVRDLQIYGGSGVRASNPAADAIALGPAGPPPEDICIDNVTAWYVNGWVLNAGAVTGAAHMSVQGLRGMNNAGGVKCAAAAPVTAQIALTDIDIQQCELNPALHLENVYDIGVSWLNCSVGSGSGIPNVPTVHLIGGVAAALFANIDAGVFIANVTPPPVPKSPVLLIEGETITTSTGPVLVTPRNVTFNGGIIQAGQTGVQLDECDAIAFSNVVAAHNRGDGWRFNGDGTIISLTGCSGMDNNKASGTGYDVHVTGTAHVGLFGFGYASTQVTAALAVTSANHVTNASATYPGKKGISGGDTYGW